MLRRIACLAAVAAFSLAWIARAQVTNGAIDAATQKHLEAVAGAGMLGSHTFDYLAELSDSIGARVTGSPEAQRAVAWGVATMRGIGLENVKSESWPLWRGWTRGSAEATLIAPIRRRLMVDSMGWVGSTPANGVDADVIVVHGENYAREIERNSANWSGKVLLIVAPPPPPAGRRGGTPAPSAPQQEPGAFEKFLKAAYAAHAAAIIGGQGGRKSTGMHLTHTGILGFVSYFDVPVVSMSAEDQSELERYLNAGKTPRIHINVQNRVTDGPVESANVVGEIRGSEHPEQVIVVGGHLDSWDLATGTTDDGCGVATTLGAAEAIVRSGIKPRRTIRFVLFTGEEQGLMGSVAYVKMHAAEMPNHVAAVILDSGQGPVVELNLGGRNDLLGATRSFAEWIRNYGVTSVSDDVAFGTDTGPFTLMGLPGIELGQDSPDYRFTHHSNVDTLDKVDPATMSKDATIQALVSFWIADRPDRLASPWTPYQTRKMLTDQGQEPSLRNSGLWDLIGSATPKQ